VAKDVGLPVGTRIKCVTHKGKHRGTIARVLVPGEMYVIGWDGKGTKTVMIGSVKVHYPAEILENHLFDLTACEANKVEAL
jgi:hypothetical protein